MADVIYSPGTASRLSTGPGAVTSFVNNGKGYVPSSSGSSVRSSNSNVHSARDVDEYFGSFGGFSDLDNYINKYIKYNENLLHSAREWEEKMSNTAIQRQMEDLKKAGINPILAGRLGGATYNAVNPYYVDINPSSIAGSYMSAQSNVQASRIMANKDVDIANLNRESQERIANWYIDKDLATAGISADTQRAVANIYGNYDIKKQELINDLTDIINQRNIKNEREMNSDNLIQRDLANFRDYVANIYRLGSYSSLNPAGFSAGLDSLGLMADELKERLPYNVFNR